MLKFFNDLNTFLHAILMGVLKKVVPFNQGLRQELWSMSHSLYLWQNQGCHSLSLIHCVLQDLQAASGSQKVLHHCLVLTDLKKRISLDGFLKTRKTQFHCHDKCYHAFSEVPQFFKLLQDYSPKTVKNIYKFILT